MAHNFKQFPELSNSQMDFYYFESPHTQMVEDFTAKVIRVKDGDTIQVTTQERDFAFPIRFSKIAAPELDEQGGRESQSWLENEILGEDVFVSLAKQRIEKWGRLLGEIDHLGRNMNDMSLDLGFSIKFEELESGI